MNASARRVAVLGGIRIPFARQNGPYARASNQDMMTATLEALVGKFSLEGEDARRGRRRRRAQAQPRLQPDARVRARHAPGSPHAGLRRPAGVRHRARGDDPRRQQDRARPDRLGDRRRLRHDLGRADRDQRGPAQVLLELNRAKSNAARLKALAKLRPQQIVPADPAQRRAAHRACRWASTPRSWPREWGVTREEQDELAVAQPSQSGGGVRHRLPRRPGHAVPRARARPEPAPGHERREAGQAEAGVRRGRRDDDRRQLDPAVSDGASAVLLACEEWAAAHGLPVQAYLVDAQTAAVDHVHKREGLLMAPDLRGAEAARPQRPDPPGLRLLRDPRGVRVAGAVHAEGLGGPGLLPRAARARGTARVDRPRQAEHPRRLARRRPPVRRHRRADRRRPGQDASTRRALRPRD